MLTEKLCKNITENLPHVTTVRQQLELSFTAHFDLVSIHPFYDGNGRTSRLLMNYIQQIFNLPMAIIFTEDKADYFTALQKTRQQENMQLFFEFMYGQYEKYLQQEITAYRSLFNDKKSKGFSFVF